MIFERGTSWATEPRFQRDVSMQAEALLGRIALWFVVLIAAIAVTATTSDAGFAVHAAIVGLVAFCCW
jgi:hypothetical protein